MSTSSCEICYQSISKNRKIAYCNNCGTDFHRECIATAVAESNNCPMCKSSFSDSFKKSEGYVAVTYLNEDELKKDEIYRRSIAQPNPHTMSTSNSQPSFTNKSNPRYSFLIIGLVVLYLGLALDSYSVFVLGITIVVFFYPIYRVIMTYLERSKLNDSRDIPPMIKS